MAYNYKNDFPIFQHTDVSYIDNAATAQRPQCVLDAVADFYRCHNANPLRGLYPLSVEATDIYEQARETVCGFIGARSAREIVFTRNTTESLNLVAYSYGLTHVKAGDEVLVSIMEHHSNLLPWQMVCRQTGAELKFIECAPDGSVDLKQIESLITERTKIVAMTQVSNVLGRKYPVQEVAAMAHKKGAVMVVDGAQSTPHMPVNVQELGADFFAFSGHKVFGPMGIGGLYGREDLLEEMPPFLSGGEMIESVTRTGAVYAELPHKFEAGTVNAAGAAGLAAAIRYVQSVGFDTIQQREHDLTVNALARVLSVPHVHVLGTDKPEDHNGIITFTVDGVHPHDISEIMASDGVNIRAGHHCAQPLLAHLGLNATARASFAFYNTDEDVDRFIESLLTLINRGEVLSEQNIRYCIALVNEGTEEKIETLAGDCICVTSKGKPVKPKTLGQKKYCNAIKENTITIGVGPAGTGKTYLAVALAVTAFRAQQVNRIILTRPAVEAGEKLGFLPGDLQQKVDPYLRPLYDALFDMLGAETYQRYVERGNIEVAPLAYMRGRTLDDSFIILDEAQNTTPEQMKMFLTRLGFGSKMVITGDVTQIDLPDGRHSGLKEAIKILRNVDDIAQVTFNEKDVVRHRLVQDIIKAYEKYQEGRR